MIFASCLCMQFKYVHLSPVPHLGACSFPIVFNLFLTRDGLQYTSIYKFMVLGTICDFISSCTPTHYGYYKPPSSDLISRIDDCQANYIHSCKMGVVVLCYPLILNMTLITHWLWLSPGFFFWGEPCPLDYSCYICPQCFISRCLLPVNKR